MTVSAPVKVLPIGNKIERAEYRQNHWHVVIPEGFAYADLLQPGFWLHYAAKIQANDIITAVAADGSFDVDFRVIQPTGAGLALRERPFFEGAVGPEALTKAAMRARTPIASRIVPIAADGKPIVRVAQALDGSWNVLGIDGQPVRCGCPDASAADVAMQEYLKVTHLTMPPAQPEMALR